MLESDDKFGFIVMDGNGALFGTVSGSTKEILHKFSVELPKKHGRGTATFMFQILTVLQVETAKSLKTKKQF